MVLALLTSALAAPPAPAPPAFHAEVSELDAALRAQMVGVSWREGCPVGLDELRVITMPHRTFEGGVETGRLIVAAGAVGAVEAAFRAAFEEGFPIARMVPVDAYGGDDDRSMAANNTSGFNCRPISGGSSWSQHSYGTAIDVNPVHNPFVRGERVDPEAGRRWLDRESGAPGVLTAGSAMTRAFLAAGWGWGGTWRSSRDYQHFSQTGR